MATTLSSPGVEVREIDNSLRLQASGGTTVFIPGFASQGPVEEITSISSITDFEQIFGVPTNAAERYFYYTVLAVLNNASTSTTILVSRLPYGEGEGDTVSNAFTVLAYPAAAIKSTVKTVYDDNGKVISADKKYKKWENGFIIKDDPDDKKYPWGKSIFQEGNNTIETENNLTFLVGEPTTYQMSLNEYYKLLTDVLFKDGADKNLGWSSEPGAVDTWENLRHAAFIVVNKSRSIINESLEGFYFGLNDNMFNEPNNYGDNSKEYDNIKSIKFSNVNTGENHSGCSGENYQLISENKLDFELQGSNQGSLSRVIQKDTSSYTSDNPELDDVISCGLFKLTKSTNGAKALKLVYDLKETYNFSLGSSRETSSVNTTKPVSLYGPNVTKNSNNIVISVNPYIAKSIKVDINGDVIGRIRIANDKLLNKLFVIDDPDEWLNGDKLNVANNRSTVIRAGVDYDTLKRVLGLDDCDVKFDIDYIKKCQSLYSFGTYTLDKKANTFIGSVTSKLTRALTLIDNDEEWPDIDIICEGGLGTINVYSKVDTSQITSDKGNVVESWLLTFEESEDEEVVIIDYNAGDETPESGKPYKDKTIDKAEMIARNFVDTIVIRGLEDLRSGKSNLNDDASVVKQHYMSVQNTFLSFANTFANGGRGDVFYLPDMLRGILVKGVDTKVESLYGLPLENSIYSKDDKVNNSWSTSIYYPIKHLYDEFTSSFAAVYAQMFKVEDTFSNKFIWVPASGYIAAAMCASDTLAGPWLAAAGLNRGIVQGVLDVAVNPVLRQRDDLYKISINSIPKMTNIGAVIYGIRTMIKKPTSFDQVTCRRTALLLGKTMKKYLRYYVFEPNTAYTRLAMYNDLQPYLESIKAAGGIYNYRLVTNESINTPEIINNGEMAVACAVQYTRTAEFVTLSMTAEKYSSTVSVTES